MTPEQQAVQRFHERFGYPVADAPCVPQAADLGIRMALLREEVRELDAAFDARDLEAIADALGDILYVTYGTAVVCGLDLGSVVAAIHRSNMSKTPSGGPKPSKGEGFATPQIREAIGARDGPP